MKKFIQRFAVMSAVFMMFCVTTAAQSGKSTENTRNGSSGVIVSPNSFTLTSGEYGLSFVTLEEGYAHPFLIYDGEDFQIDEEIITDSFEAVLLNDGTIVIMAFNVKKIVEDVFYVRALSPLDDELSRNTRTVWGTPIYITINPSLNKEQSNQTSSVKK